MINNFERLVNPSKVKQCKKIFIYKSKNYKKNVYTSLLGLKIFVFGMVLLETLNALA